MKSMIIYLAAGAFCAGSIMTISLDNENILLSGNFETLTPRKPPPFKVAIKCNPRGCEGIKTIEESLVWRWWENYDEESFV